MTLPRIPSTDIGADLRLVDTRLRELYYAEKGDIVTSDMPGPKVAPTSTLDNEQLLARSGGQPTSNLTSALPSGCSTPWELDTEEQCSKTTRPQEPRRFNSSVIQVRKDVKKKWYTYGDKGVKITTKYFYQEIDSSWTIVLIVACYFVSGLVDSVAYSVWSCFVGMQTGNTIFLAIRIANEPDSRHPLNYVKSLVSIVSYCVGALIFNCLHRAPGGLSNSSAPLHRWTLLTSFIIQSGLLTTAAILAQTHVLSNQAYQGRGTFSSGNASNPGNNYLDLIGISLLAFEAAGQVCLSRVLLINELPTIVLSTAYHDLIGDALSMRKCWRQSKTGWDFAVSQKKQIRRLSAILSLFVGSLIGGFVFPSSAGLAGGLWVAAATKILICIAWCLWKKKLVTETVVTRQRSKLQAPT